MGRDDNMLVESIDDSSKNKAGDSLPTVLSNCVPSVVNGFAVLLCTTGLIVV